MIKRSIKLDGMRRHTAALAALIALGFFVYFTAKLGFANTAARNAPDLEIAQYAAELSPNDPQARLAHASKLENSFDLGNIDRALREYETAVSLAPRNYLLWLALGRARERSGDRAAAETAYREALLLAPAYATTHWALGNNLVRQGRTEEGMDLIRSAIGQDGSYAAPAASAVMIVFDGDVEASAAALAGHPQALAHLASLLARDAKLDQAIATWRKIDAPERKKLAEQGTQLLQASVAAKRFREALSLAVDITGEGEKYRPESIANGGFERSIDLAGKGPFDWQIGSGVYPQIGLFESDPREGRYSLAMIFNVPTNQAFRPVSITTAVEPGAAYDLSFAWKANLQTRARFQWEIVSAADGQRLAISDALSVETPWLAASLAFKAPADGDGITLRLIRDNCSTSACTISGSLWIDDLKLVRAGK